MANCANCGCLIYKYQGEERWEHAYNNPKQVEYHDGHCDCRNPKPTKAKCKKCGHDSHEGFCEVIVRVANNGKDVLCCCSNPIPPAPKVAGILG